MFTTELDCTFLPDGVNVRLNAPLLWRDPLTDEEIGPDAGYESNGASSPWYVWWFFPPWGRWSRSAVWHDWVVETQKVSWFFAAALFYVMMVSDGVAWRRRWPAYFAVRYLRRLKRR